MVLDQDLNSIKGAATVRNLRPGTASTPLHATFGGFALDADDVIVDYTHTTATSTSTSRWTATTR